MKMCLLVPLIEKAGRMGLMITKKQTCRSLTKWDAMVPASVLNQVKPAISDLVGSFAQCTGDRSVKVTE